MGLRFLSWLRFGKGVKPAPENHKPQKRGHHIVTLSRHTRLDSLPKGVPRFGKRPTWIHLNPENDLELLDLLNRYFIHPLTVEDIFNPYNRIKREKFPQYIYLCFRGVQLKENFIITKDFNFMLTDKTIITIAESERKTIDDLLANESLTRELLRKGPEFILHKILDVETDHTLQIVHDIDVQFEQQESKLFNYTSDVNITSVFELRSSLAQIKKMILTHKEIFDEMQLHDKKFFSAESEAFFRDIRDHAIKGIDTIDGISQAIASAIEAYHTMSTKRTNDVMRTLTVMTSIMLPMTLITGIFGMNFTFIPLLKDELGYLWTLIFMLGLGFVMLIFFRLKKWV